MHRRQFLRLAAALAGSALAGPSPWRSALAAIPASGGPSPYGPLLDPDANGLRLPAGFQSRIVARSGQPVAGTGFVWPIFPDGGATFRDGSGGWIYVSNSEAPPFPNAGGASAIRFGPSGAILDAYKILSDTLINCAGGATPWGTWLSCEEHAGGMVWECDPKGVREAVGWPGMGVFQHEAVAADPVQRRFYLTEDEPDGRFYRFTPTSWGDLGSGLLEVAQVKAAGAVLWLPVPEPAPDDVSSNATRHQVPDSTPFDGGEGICWHKGRIYFTTKGDGRVWDYDPRRARLGLIYDDALDPSLQLTGVDNVTASKSGELVFTEDKRRQQQVVLITRGGQASPFVEADQVGSEFAGPAFDPSGLRLYFSSQRGPGPGGLGITYEVSGPFRLRNGTAAIGAPLP